MASVFDRNKQIDIAVGNGLRDLSAGIDTAANISARILATYGASAQTVFDSMSGLVGSGLPTSLIPQFGKTAVVSLLATGNTNVDLPVISGKRAIICFGAFVLTSRTGTATGSLVWQVGTNSTNFDNLIAQKTVAAAAFNATTFSLPFSLPLAIDATSGGMPDMGSQVVLRISTAITGASVLQGRFGIQALYV